MLKSIKQRYYNVGHYKQQTLAETILITRNLVGYNKRVIKDKRQKRERNSKVNSMHILG